ncbi:hypothetical protein ACNT2N_12825 [Pseudomonas thivervalensis]|uniref:hypothetical protein n=1 Tax=Pseudomonas thivervalensis TaxID=86265 RepID=UPI00209676E0|nr:hypothetical protein [Pseudomonas thivervalensis]
MTPTIINITPGISIDFDLKKKLIDIPIPPNESKTPDINVPLLSTLYIEIPFHDFAHLTQSRYVRNGAQARRKARQTTMDALPGPLPTRQNHAGTEMS